eukprot:scaffold1133_cov72-Cyclotella_meneghiniana.AAC.4
MFIFSVITLLSLILVTNASRAYPHGCLYRHPSYYTYDEREDISWADGQFSDVETGEMEEHEQHHTDFRKLPPPSSKLRRFYERYRLTRRLGAGKFSEVYEAVDLGYTRHQKNGDRRRVGGAVHDAETTTDCSTETDEEEADCESFVVLKVSFFNRFFAYRVSTSLQMNVN